MTHQYDYKWIPFIRGYSFCLAIIGYSLFTMPSDERSLVSFLFAVTVLCVSALVLFYVAPVCKITLSDKELKLSFANPFIADRRIDLNDIQAYTETNAAFSNTVEIGEITTTKGHSVKIRSSGTDNFKDLSEQLSGLYPTRPSKK